MEMVIKYAACIGLILGVILAVVGLLDDQDIIQRKASTMATTLVMSGAIVFGSSVIALAIATRRQDDKQ